MTYVRRSKGWELPESQVTPEAVYRNRREFLRALGLGSLSAAAVLAGCSPVTGQEDATGPPHGGSRVDPNPPGGAKLYPAERAPKFQSAGRPLTPEKTAASYNNFYEFTTDKAGVWRLVEKFETRPWSVEIGGLCHKPGTYDLDELARKLGLEERIYRFRCVEAWAMTVPWTGFPAKALLDHVQPLQKAKYVRFVSFLRPEQAPGQKTQSWYPWPYFEALRLDEAANELALFATGIYGHALPKQHGAPVRLVTPWKYGYKSIKSIVRIEFTEEQPPTFWNRLQAREYGFYSNVDPEAPHPRWSQASERLISSGERIPTVRYNGYGEWVAELYRNLPRGSHV